MLQDDDDYWQERLRDLSRNQLDTVRKAGAAWSAVFSAVLGLFGTVVFVGGLAGLDEVSSGKQSFIRWAIATALVCALLATGFSGSIGFPEILKNQTTEHIRDLTIQRARTALCRLRWAVFFGALAGLTILVATVTVLFSDKAPTPLHVITTFKGSLICGVLQKAEDNSLTVDGMRLTEPRSITVVSSCP
ncbi:hypothetical protein [Mycobacterium asiaticum]|nr:hypothetical protein [Mycobacterium asiaticum]